MNIFEEKEVVARVQKMETYLDDILAAKETDPDNFLNDQEIARKLRELIDYYENGQWLRDYECDERGELPRDLKRGVLAEDAVYDLLSEIDG